MKWHHIVGIITGICAIGLVVDKVSSANIIDTVITFILLSTLAVSTFFKDRLPSHLTQRRIPTSSVLLIIVGILLFCTVVLDALDYFR